MKDKEYKFGDKIFLRGVQYTFVAFSASKNTVWVLDYFGILKRFPSSFLLKPNFSFFYSPVLPFVSDTQNEG